MKRSVILIVAGAALVALVAAGCGSSNKSSGGSSASSQTTTQVASKSATVSLGSTGLGKMLVGPNGRTLYLFEKDMSGKSSCSGDCVKDWPPLTTNGKPKAGSGIDAAK